MAPIAWDREATLAKIESIVGRVSASISWVDMILLPELILDALSAYSPTPSSIPQPEPIPGPTTDRMCALAAKHRRWLIPGSMSEKAGDAVYNTTVAISPAGEVVAKYRKVFPWRPLETCEPGKDFVTFDVPGAGRVGLLICYDMWFPEVARTLAWMGAELILHPSLTFTADRSVELVISQANAIFNQCYFVDINGTGPYGGGRSLIVDPHGTVLQQADQHETVITELLDLDLVSQTRELGTKALDQVWKQLRDVPVSFPPYVEGLAASPMARELGPLRYPKSPFASQSKE
jgi:formamidase